MIETAHGSSKGRFDKLMGRRGLIRGAGAAIGASLLSPKIAIARRNDDDEHASRAVTQPIPGGVAPFAPFGVMIHHNPLNPSLPLASLNDPSQITDFDGFVGLTHIRGGGTGINTATGAASTLGFQADMGFSQGKFVDLDGHHHEGTFAFV